MACTCSNRSSRSARRSDRATGHKSSAPLGACVGRGDAQRRSLTSRQQPSRNSRAYGRLRRSMVPGPGACASHKRSLRGTERLSHRAITAPSAACPSQSAPHLLASFPGRHRPFTSFPDPLATTFWGLFRRPRPEIVSHPSCS